MGCSPYAVAPGVPRGDAVHDGGTGRDGEAIRIFLLSGTAGSLMLCGRETHGRAGMD
jgi:hypothetical protein